MVVGTPSVAGATLHVATSILPAAKTTTAAASCFSHANFVHWSALVWFGLVCSTAGGGRGDGGHAPAVPRAGGGGVSCLTSDDQGKIDQHTEGYGTVQIRGSAHGKLAIRVQVTNLGF